MGVLIANFKIKKLYGHLDINIDFNSPVKILIGENGIGKTTTMNMLAMALQRDFIGLANYDFSSLTINFGNGIEATLESTYISTRRGVLLEIERNLLEDCNLLKSEISLQDIGNSGFDYKAIISRRSVSTRKYIEELLEDEAFIHKFNFARLICRAMDGYDLIHFPTYRRAEHNLTVKEGERIYIRDSDTMRLREPLRMVQSSMDDVEEIIKEKCRSILSGSRSDLDNFAKEILNDIIFKKSFDKVPAVNRQKLKVALSRLSDRLDIQDNGIEALLHNIDGSDQLNQTLQNYFLSKLILIYEAYDKEEKFLQDFAEQCNKYLLEKKFVYDEKTVSMEVKLDFSPRPLSLNHLSSGEKQLISFFSIIYFNKSNKLCVLIDEPEISFSPEWQKVLIHDIMKTGKCQFLFAATHSPFIFENEYFKDTQSLRQYISKEDEPNAR